MTSSSVLLERFCFSPKFTKHNHTFNYNYTVSQSISSPKHFRPLILNHLPRRASSEFTNSIERDENEDSDSDLSKFVPLNTEDPAFGPPALLLLGFQNDEIINLEQLLKEMGADFLEIILCTEEMMKGTLWEAVNGKRRMRMNSNGCLKKIGGNSLPRICIMSGLTGEEMITLIDSFNGGGFEGTVFAALVPNSAHKTLDEVVEEIMADHQTVMSTK